MIHALNTNRERPYSRSTAAPFSLTDRGGPKPGLASQLSASSTPNRYLENGLAFTACLPAPQVLQKQNGTPTDRPKRNYYRMISRSSAGYFFSIWCRTADHEHRERLLRNHDRPWPRTRVSVRRPCSLKVNVNVTARRNDVSSSYRILAPCYAFAFPLFPGQFTSKIRSMKKS